MASFTSLSTSARLTVLRTLTLNGRSLSSEDVCHIFGLDDDSVRSTISRTGSENSPGSLLHADKGVLHIE